MGHQKKTLTSIVLAAALAACGGDSVPAWRFIDGGPRDSRVRDMGPPPEPTPCPEGSCVVPGYEDHPCTGDEECHPPALCELDPTLFGSGFCVDPDRICEFTHECDLYSLEQCVAGYCTVVSPEVCDGLDNDRNGITDFDLAPRLCYTGISETRNVGLCRDGVQICDDGDWTVCLGDLVPIPEDGILSCDRRDNDCDGCPDNRYDDAGRCFLPDPVKYDFVFIFDVSGSMTDIITSVADASIDFASSFDANPDFRFALLIHPLLREQTDYRLTREIGFSDYSELRDAMTRSIPYTRDGIRSPDEQSYDIPYMAASGAYGGDLAFRDDARRVYIMFTDELPQSKPFPGFPLVEETLMCGSFRPDDLPIMFTWLTYFNGYDLCCRNFELSFDPAEMSDNLHSAIDSVCDRWR